MAHAAATVVLALGAVAAFGMLFSLGGNDVANSIGVATASGAIALRPAIAVAACMNLLGALLAGTNVTANVVANLVPFLSHRPQAFTHACAYLVALLSTVFVISTGTMLALPLSSTHALIGALSGATLALASATTTTTSPFHAVNWTLLRTVALAWVTSPLLGFAFTLTLRLLLRCAAKSPAAHAAVLPVVGAAAAAGIVAVPAVVGPPMVRKLFSGGEGRGGWCVMVAVVGAVFVAIWAVIAALVWRRMAAGVDFHALAGDGGRKGVKGVYGGKGEVGVEGHGTEGDAEVAEVGLENEIATTGGQSVFRVDENSGIFRALLICTVPAVAFAHGSNDVSNGVGPFLGILQFYLLSTGRRTLEDVAGGVGSSAAAGAVTETRLVVPVLLVGGVAIGAGVLLFGGRVIGTVGHGGISRGGWSFAGGFAAQAGAAGSVLLASVVGVPVSTSHTIVGCVMACGLRLPGCGGGGGSGFGGGGEEEEEGEGEGLNVPMISNIAIGAVVTPLLAGIVSAVGMGTFLWISV